MDKQRKSCLILAGLGIQILVCNPKFPTRKRERQTDKRSERQKEGDREGREFLKIVVLIIYDLTFRIKNSNKTRAFGSTHTLQRKRG